MDHNSSSGNQDQLRSLKKRIEELEESEIKYRSVFESSKDGILIADQHMVITETNQSISDLLGYRKEELIGISYF